MGIKIASFMDLGGDDVLVQKLSPHVIYYHVLLLDP